MEPSRRNVRNKMRTEDGLEIIFGANRVDERWGWIVGAVAQYV